MGGGCGGAGGLGGCWWLHLPPAHRHRKCQTPTTKAQYTESVTVARSDTSGSLLLGYNKFAAFRVVLLRGKLYQLYYVIQTLRHFSLSREFSITSCFIFFYLFFFLPVVCSTFFKHKCIKQLRHIYHIYVYTTLFQSSTPYIIAHYWNWSIKIHLWI